MTLRDLRRGPGRGSGRRKSIFRSSTNCFLRPPGVPPGVPPEPPGAEKKKSRPETHLLAPGLLCHPGWRKTTGPAHTDRPGFSSGPDWTGLFGPDVSVTRTGPDRTGSCLKFYVKLPLGLRLVPPATRKAPPLHKKRLQDGLDARQDGQDGHKIISKFA